MPTFTNCTALVTGAASGIGLAVAAHLAEHGAARLILVDRDAAALARVDLPCPVTRAPGDVRDEGFWDALDLSGLDLAVAGAGVAGASPIVDHTLAEWRRILSVDLDGAFLTLRAAMRAMKAGGAVVCVASAAEIKAEAGVAAYGASNAALLHFARVAAFAELAAMTTPLGRYAKPEEIAGQIAFLPSDAAATITGSVLVSDGGHLL